MSAQRFLFHLILGKNSLSSDYPQRILLLLTSRTPAPITRTAPTT